MPAALPSGLPACLPTPAGKEVEETLHIVDAQTQEAAAKKQVVEGEEAIASEKAAAAKAIKVRCGCDYAHSAAKPLRASNRCC